MESTSGNLGYALGILAREMGRDFLALVDESIAPRKLRRLQEAKIRYRCIKSEGGEDARMARIAEAQRLMERGPYYWVRQYDNPAGVLAHEETTGPELWQQCGGALTHCVVACGTCGTICGLGRFLKRVSPGVQICAVEPLGSTIFGKSSGPYLNAGAGLAEKPGNLLREPGLVDRDFQIPDAKAIACARELYHRFGLSVGITGGMAYAAALEIAEREEGASIAVLVADGREWYPQQLKA